MQGTPRWTLGGIARHNDISALHLANYPPGKVVQKRLNNSILNNNIGHLRLAGYDLRIDNGV